MQNFISELIFSNLNLRHKNTVLRNRACSITTCLFHSEMTTHWYITWKYVFLFHALNKNQNNIINTGYWVHRKKSQKLIPGKKNQIICPYRKNHKKLPIHKNKLPQKFCVTEYHPLPSCTHKKRCPMTRGKESSVIFLQKKKPRRLAFCWQVVNDKYWSNFHFKYSL